MRDVGLPVDRYGLDKFGSRSSAYVSIRDTINDLIQSLQIIRQTGYKNDQHRDCHQAFKNSTYEQFKNINSDRVEQTCQWALTHPLYRDWKKSHMNNLVWTSTDPGCG